MTPAKFVEKWGRSELRERQGSQSHFNDLCALLGVLDPATADPAGEHFCFERGAEKVGGGDGWADVWKRGCFAWEYKGKHKDLDAALRQVVTYSRDLENPPYLVVSDMARIVVHTNWTNTVARTYELSLDDLLDPKKLHILQAVFEGSEELRPKLTPQDLTAKVAERFGKLGQKLQEKHEPRAVAHFLNRLVFCMFAEDAGLLAKDLFTRTMKATHGRTDAARAQLSDLFGKMARQGDTYFGPEYIRWFNGGLFDDDATLPLDADDLTLIAATAEEHDWSEIDPAVFGTLFEQALKATRERPALGAHYTDREKILKIVDPVIRRPLEVEWEAALAQAREAMARAKATQAERAAVLEAASAQMRHDPQGAKAGEAARRKKLNEIERRRVAAHGEAKAAVEAWLTKLAGFRVLDPACGSGNFLYVALHTLLDLEQRAIIDAERLGLTGFLPRVDLKAVRGIEIERYAAELARLTLWIGYLQWQLKNKVGEPPEPVLSKLDQIENRDALLNPDGTEAEWPAVDAIIGNPPFLGGKRMRSVLGSDYTATLRAAFEGRVPPFADFVCYWLAKSWSAYRASQVARTGLVATNSVRGGASREVLRPISEAGAIYDAWSDEPWIVEGAAVRVSLVCFGETVGTVQLDGETTTHVQPDLTSGGFDLTTAGRLTENRATCFEGGQKYGEFDIDAPTARSWLLLPINPNGQPNSDVLRPYLNAQDVVRRSEGRWIVDFGGERTEEEASLYEAPFAWVAERVRPERASMAREIHRRYWWRHGWFRVALNARLATVRRAIVTPVVSKHRVFAWMHPRSFATNLLDVVVRDDDTTFGILHSRAHEVWALRMGTSLEDRPRYTPSTTLETFPFPEGLTPNIPATDYADDPRAQAIGEAARRLNELRENWLNPADLTVREPEVVAGYPDRILPRDEEAAKVLKTRTLTNLYNQRPAWLEMAHRALDEAVAAAYGWPANSSDDEMLERLFALNQERAAAGR